MGAQVGNRWVEALHTVRGQPPMKISKRVSPAKPRLNSIKKILFPPDDDDVVCPKQICNTQLQLAQEAQRKRWNFDFAHGKPIEGPFQWEPMSVNGVPVPARQPRARCATVQEEESSSSDDSRPWTALMDEKAEVQTHPILSSSSIKAPATTSSPKPSSSTGPKLKQPKITDVFKERKRRLSSTVPAETISVKKVRMLSAASPDNAPQQQQEGATN
uniref:Cyclin-dependent kinase inhibitor domain-containing protein n=1 Tax=Anopheles culicifacies TaxID=139723 RepID=A0A182MS94_9DIPT